MLMLRVVRLMRRAPRCASSAWSVRETLAGGRRRASAALEKLPASTTRAKTFIARKRSMLGFRKRDRAPARARAKGEREFSSDDHTWDRLDRTGDEIRSRAPGRATPSSVRSCVETARDGRR